jgi:rhodanese-related sulfurtransferase
MRQGVASIVVLAVGLLSVGGSRAQQAPQFPVDEKKIAIGAKETSPDEIKKQMAAGGKFMLIHVDPAENYAKETIPGAVSIPLAELPERLKTIPKDTVLVFACNRGPRSSQAAKIAEEAGFTATSFCPIMKWKEQGNPTEPGKKTS